MPFLSLLRALAFGLSLGGSIFLTQAQASPVIYSPEHSPAGVPIASPTPQSQTYQTQGIIFETPVGFSPLKPMGGQTNGVIFPAAAQTRHVSVRLLAIQPSDIGIATLNPRELAEYVRFQILGLTTSPRDHQIRRFMGQTVTGDVLMQPKNGGISYLEFYLVPLTLDRQLAIAFEADTELPVALLEQTIQTVSASLREDPAFNKKKKRYSPSSSLN